MRLQDKTAVVTGAAGGIGSAISARFAQEGARVVCVDIDGPACQRQADHICAAGGRAISVPADVSTEDGNAAIFDATLQHFDGLDVFVANAAVQAVGRLEATRQAWDRLYQVNLRGAYLGVVSATPLMRERGGGSIILVASLLGIVGDPDLPAYGATKGGLRALCRSLATAFGPEGIRVNTICPGDVVTPLLEDFFAHQDDPERMRRELIERYPLRRFAQPADVAGAALFLASDEASYITGVDIVVDGGLLARIY